MKEGSDKLKLGSEKLLHALNSSFQGLDEGTLYYKAKLEKGFFLTCLKELQNYELIVYQQGFISLSEKGQREIDSGLLTGKSVKRIKFNEGLYPPNLKLLDL